MIGLNIASEIGFVFIAYLFSFILFIYSFGTGGFCVAPFASYHIREKDKKE